MLELAASHVEKGQFELKLESEGPKWTHWVHKFGPVRSRLFALVFICAAALLNFTMAPAHFFLTQGWATSSFQALDYKTYLQWLLAGTGVALWMMAFSIRKESLILLFDRINSKLHYRYSPAFSLGTVEEDTVPFTAIQRIEVFGPHRTPKTPHGFIEIQFAETPQDSKAYRFKILSEDQFKFYPTNLGRITGKDPIGDWVDPDNI